MWLAFIALWQLIQKITVAYLIVSFNICILFHFPFVLFFFLLFFVFEALALLATFQHSTFPVNGFSYLLLVYASFGNWTQCRSWYSNWSLAWESYRLRVDGVGQTVEQKMRSGFCINANNTHPLPFAQPLNLHFYGPPFSVSLSLCLCFSLFLMLSWWNVVQVVAFYSFFSTSIEHSRHFHAGACERLHLSCRLTACRIRILAKNHCLFPAGRSSIKITRKKCLYENAKLELILWLGFSYIIEPETNVKARD